MEDVAGLRQLNRPYDLCFGVFASRVEIKGSAAWGTVTVPDSTMSFAEISRPYTRRLSPLSGRIVEPSRETPAKSPRSLEELKISAPRDRAVSSGAYGQPGTPT